MGQGCVWSKQVAQVSSSLFSASQSNCLKGNEIEQMVIRQQVWSYLRTGRWIRGLLPFVFIVFLVSSGMFNTEYIFNI